MSQTPMDKPDAESLLTGDEETFDVFENMDQIREQNQEIAQERTELEQAYAAVFTTQEGRKVLNDLIDRYIKRQSFNPMDDNAEKVGFYLEGQKATVADIVQKANAGIQKNE